MSVQAIAWVFGDSARGWPGLQGPTSSNRLVLLALANHAGAEGDAWPGVKTIAREAGVTDKTAKRALKWLQDNGYITKLDDSGPPAAGSPKNARRNWYRLNFDAERGDEITPPVDKRGGVNRAQEGGQIAPARGGKSRPFPAPIHIKEPVIEPLGNPAASQAKQPVDNQTVAKQVAEWYWEGVKKRTNGRSPTGIKFIALLKIIEAALKQYDASEVRAALRLMYDSGASISGQSLDRYLTGRAVRQRPAAGKELATQTLAFDADGNLL